MAEPVGALRVDVGANAAALQNDMNQVRGIVNSTAANMQRSFVGAASAINGAVSGMIKRVVAAVSGVALVNAAKKAAATFDEIHDKAEQVGLSTDFLQVLQFAAVKEGVKGLDTALDQFAHRSDEAKRATGELWEQMRRLNPELANQIRLATGQEQRIKLVADAIQRATTAEQKAAIARAAFGKSGIEMTRILREGTAGLDDFRKRAEEMGLVLDKDFIKQMSEVNKQFEVATKILDTQFKQAVVGLIGPLTSVAQWLGAIARGAGGIFNIFKSSDSLGTKQLEERLEDLKGQLEKFGRGSKFDQRYNPFFDAENVKQQITEIEAELEKRKEKLKIDVGPKEDPAHTEIIRKMNEQLIKRIAVLKAESETLGLNTKEKEAAKLAAEVLGDATARGIPVTESLTQKVGELAAKYGEAARQAETAKNRFKAIEDAAKDFTSAVGDLFKGVVIEGKKFDEVLQDILKRLSGKAVDRLFELLLLGPTGNLQAGGGILGSIFSGMRASGGPVMAGNMYEVGERGREWFVPNTNGTIIPNDALRGPAGGGLTYAPVINAPGADPAQLRRVEMVLVEQGRAFQQTMRQQNSAGHFSRTGVQ